MDCEMVSVALSSSTHMRHGRERRERRGRIRTKTLSRPSCVSVLPPGFGVRPPLRSCEDRQKVVRDAYVGSPRKQRYLGEIDRIIRNPSPALAAEVPLIEDPAAPVEVTKHFDDLPSLRNKILLLVGAVGCGKSTFVDHLREVSLPDELKQHTAWVRIDLNPAPVTKDEIYHWLRQQIIAGIRATAPDIDTTTLANLQILYRQQVQEFQKGEGALFPPDSAPHNERLANLLAALKQDHLVTIRCLEQFLCTGRG